MVNESRPTEEQAAQYARLVEAGVPSREAVDAILSEAADDVRAVCADEWPGDGRVQAARIALNGGKTWVAMSDAAQIAYALRLAYASMAYAVVSALPTLTAEAPGLRRVLDFIDRLEAQDERIGKAGAPVSGRTGWEDFQEQLKKTDPELAEALKAPEKKKRVS
jgi:hypothetical protein